MTKKKWGILILLIILLAGYFILFYKTYSVNTVPKTADCILALDLKAVRNTIIWNTITSPEQWKKISFSSTGKTSWKDMVVIPDYVFVFHVAGQPLNAWYTVLEIKDKQQFKKGLANYHFEQQSDSNKFPVYVSKELGVAFVQDANRLLVANPAVKDKNLIKLVSEELFSKKQYISNDVLVKNTNTGSHLTVQITPGHFLKEPAIITADFDKNSIVVDGTLSPQKDFAFSENKFSYPGRSLCATGFVQPSASTYSLLPASAKASISSALNFDIDSLLLPGNAYYNLDITGIRSRVDSAVSYSYDDNFDPVEKVVLNNVWEPSFCFTTFGKNTKNIYDYWNRNGKLEQTATGELFIPMPFVKSYCSQQNENELLVASADYRPKDDIRSVDGIFFLHVLLTALPPELSRYLPDDMIKATENIESMELVARKEGTQIKIRGNLHKKKNDRFLFNW